jgi:hypothetical protein
MTVSKVTCPECATVLRPAKPLPVGKKVKCPRCGSVFTAQEEGPGPKAEPQPKGAGGQKPAPEKAGAAKKGAPDKPPAQKKDEDDEGGGAYAVIKEEEVPEEEKPQIEYAPDMSIKDLRGPAQEKVVRPSNGLMIAGALGVIWSLLCFAYYGWPFIFSKYLVDHKAVLEAHYKSRTEPSEREKAKNIPEDRDKLSQEELTIVKEANIVTKDGDVVRGTDADRFRRVIGMITSFVTLVFSGFQVFAATKMQNLESYGWSMAAAILGIIPLGGCCLLSVPMGIWALVTLKDEEVIAGFKYEPE